VAENPWPVSAASYVVFYFPRRKMAMVTAASKGLDADRVGVDG